MKQIVVRALIVGLSTFPSSLGYAEGTDCSRLKGSLPDQTLPAGLARADIPIENVIVIMQENRSFDHYFSQLNQSEFYGHEVDGLDSGTVNIGPLPTTYVRPHSTSLCPTFIGNSWAAMHSYFDQGKMDRFPRVTLPYFDQSDIPYDYSLANQFAIADHYFSSVLGPTMPNRLYLMAATSRGRTGGINPAAPPLDRTIFHNLTHANITWKVYAGATPWYSVYRSLYAATHKRHVGKYKLDHFSREVVSSDFEKDLNQGTLPQVVFIDSTGPESEHPSANIQYGQAFVARHLQMLMASPYWKKSVAFVTYDEGGGFFDHVPPPVACKPDGANAPGGGAFDRYGFRVPLIAVSPYAKHHFISHQTYDHTSILKFIETKFNLPALTRRDANANDLSDLFDYSLPDFSIPPLPSAARDPSRECH